MSTDASPLMGPSGTEASAKVTSKWDDLQPALPKSVDGSHLAPCPQCGMENGALALQCWNCEASLTPGAPLRLVTKDGAEVAAPGADSEYRPEPATVANANAFAGLDLSALAAADTQDPSMGQEPGTGASAQGEASPQAWTPDAEQGVPVGFPATPTRTGGVDLRVIGAVFIAALFAGAWGYYKAHSDGPASSAVPFGAVPPIHESAGRSPWSDAPGAGESTNADPSAAPGNTRQSVDDALAAAERALSSVPPSDATSLPVAAPSFDPPARGELDPSGAAVSAKPSERRREASDGNANVRKASGSARSVRSQASPPPVPGRSCSPTLAALGLCQGPSP